MIAASILVLQGFIIGVATGALIVGTLYALWRR